MVQTSSYLPHFISLVVVCGMVISFLASDGPINSLIKSVGRAAHSLAAAARVVCPGLHLFRDLAGCRLGIGDLPGRPDRHQLGSIEAAVIDGANRWQRLRHITLPGIAPTVTIMFLLRIGQLLTVDFQKVLLLYTPATYETADILGTYIYRRGIVGADFSFAHRRRSLPGAGRAGLHRGGELASPRRSARYELW